MTEYIILMPLLIIMLGLVFIVASDSYINHKQKKIMSGIIGLITLLIVQNVADYLLQLVIELPYLRTLVSIVGYVIRPIIIVLFCKLVKPNGRNTAAWILVIINAAVYLTATFSKAVFYIDETNHYQGGAFGGMLSNTAFVICFALLFHLMYCTVSVYRNRGAKIWIAITNVAIIFISALLDVSPAYLDYPVSYTTIAVVCCSLFYYIWLHLEFAREHEKALMAEQRVKIMISQIQPHFLYNTLSTIQALCQTDPQKAFETTEKFGLYLRNNIDSLDQPELIPFEKELEHTKIYADIEMIRFSKISVEYNINVSDFCVPALSIQPLVENAIRHGVRSREHGIVNVETRIDENGFNEILISDNGVGFDVNELCSKDGAHIGITNVKERIEEMCEGTFDIDSRIGKGTKITIKLPRETK